MQAKRIVSIIIVLLIVGAGYYFLINRPVIGSAIEVSAYTVNGASNGGAAVSVPFLRDGGADRWVNVALDLNSDGEFATYETAAGTQEEWVVRNMPGRVKAELRNNFHFNLVDPALNFDSVKSVSIALSRGHLDEWRGEDPRAGEYLSADAEIAPYEVAGILGLNVPGAQIGLSRGAVSATLSTLTPRAVFAQGDELVDVDSELELVEIKQGEMECVPTSVANNISALTKKNGGPALPGTQEMIDELKTDFQFQNGVLNQNFMAGKNAFVARHNLPIVTEVKAYPSVDDIREAIESGAGVEMDLDMFSGATGGQSSSHTVAVTGVFSDGAQHGIRGNDSATASGTELWEFFPADESQRYPQLRYPLWDGPVVISRIYIQRWVAQADNTSQSQTSVGSPYSEADGPSQIEMLVLGPNEYYPKAQFNITDETGCGAPHYHKDTPAYGLHINPDDPYDYQVIFRNDPGPQCGFGKVPEVPVEQVYITFEMSTELAKSAVGESEPGL